MSETDQELLAYARLGDDADTFRSTPLGRYLFGTAQQETQLAAIEISKLNPLSLDFEEKFNAQQRRIQCALWLDEWFTELIQRGEEAYRQWEQRNSDG